MTRNHDKKLKYDIPGLAEDTKRFVEDIQEETDRGVALSGTAFLDDVIIALLRAAFVDNPMSVEKVLEYPGPINSLAARADLAYCLGLLGNNMYADLKIIRKIRNEFAHSHVPISFDKPYIKEMCDILKTPQLIPPHVTNHPRYLFIIAVILLANQIIMRGLSLKHAEVGKDFILGKHVKV